MYGLVYLSTQCSLVTSPATLRLLAKSYPDVSSVLHELALLKSRLTLPRPITHIISDIHGEHAKLRHVVNNASGALSKQVRRIFEGKLSETEQEELLAFLYYPVEKFQLLKNENFSPVDQKGLIRRILRQQFQLVRALAKNHTREELIALIPDDQRALFSALLDEAAYDRNPTYVNSMLGALSDYGQDIHAVHMASRVVRNLSIDEIVVAGDIPDRGPRADKVIHFLKAQPKVSITWGNHDAIWMGACLGSPAMIATVLRLSLRHLRLWQLEEGYGILLSPLIDLVAKCYSDDPAEAFQLSKVTNFSNPLELARMQKAIAIIEFKLTGQIIQRHPEWEMSDRLLLDKIDLASGTIEIDGHTLPLTDSLFPTLDPIAPYELSPEEALCMERLSESFTSSQVLWDHMRYIVDQGAMSLQRDHVLIFHACVPITDEGEYIKAHIDGKEVSGVECFRAIETIVRRAFRAGAADASETDLDTFYWMWANKASPLFGKEKMTTFERYFIAEKSSHLETKNAYYQFIDDPEFCQRLGRDFGIEKDVMIVNGHVPVKIEKGEDPVKAGGFAVSIDGAFSEDYGDYGYTLMMTPRGVRLAEHSHFESIDHFLDEAEDMIPKLRELRNYPQPRVIGETSEGDLIREQVLVLEDLLQAYRSGQIKETVG